MKIGYWAIRGKGHQLRLLAHYLGLKFENVMYTNMDDYKQDMQKYSVEFPNLPYIIDGNKNLSESQACLKYLCAKANRPDMIGKNIEDQIQVEMFKGIIIDIKDIIYRTLSQTDDLKKYQEIFEKISSKLTNINKHLEKTKNKFLMPYITFVDMSFSECLNYVQNVYRAVFKEDYLSKFPSILSYYKNLRAESKIKEFYEMKEYKLLFTKPELIKFNIEVE